MFKRFFMDQHHDFSVCSELQEQLSLLHEYLSEHYEFRHNVLSDKYELRERSSESKPFRPLTKEALNSLLRLIKCNGLEIPTLGQNVNEYIFSEETPLFDPAKDWLRSLPSWDGKNHVGEFFGRLPGITTEQHNFLATWIRSAVAHWLDKDTMHGNECVVTIIGKQGCGKSTFCASILPPHLREYYLDHLNLGNKNDKEMALTNNLIVNLDELDQVKPCQQAELKQALSKVNVNGRPIYGRAQKNRKRFASFVSTTNNPRPLCDATGSRRYLCIRIPDGELIDNEKVINYNQLYAQVMYEVEKEQLRYWFTNEEVKRIEELNQNYQRVMNLEGMLEACFRHPREGEIVHPLLVGEIISEMMAEFPSLKSTEGLNIRLGRILKSNNFEHKHNRCGSVYYIVPLRSA